MRRWSVRVGLVLLVLALGWGLRATVFASDPVVVRTASVGLGPVEATITNSKAGTVEARRRAGLSTGTAGIVVALEVERGDVVEDGDVLLRLDDTSQASELAYAECQLGAARARNDKACIAAARAQRALERDAALVEDEFVSADRLDSSRTAYDLATAECQVAAAEVALAQAAVDVARAELAKTVLTAPFDAIVADVFVELGEWATPSVALMSSPDLIDAIDPKSLYISAPMDEVDADLLRVAQPVRVTIDSHPGRSFPGRIVRIAPYVLDLEQQNRTLDVEVELEDESFSARLLPGTSADVEVVLEVRDDVLRMPAFALYESDRVLVLEEGRLVERRVETGIRNWDWVEVRAGLDPGDQVVTSLDRAEVRAGVDAIAEPVEDADGIAGGGP